MCMQVCLARQPRPTLFTDDHPQKLHIFQLSVRKVDNAFTVKERVVEFNFSFLLLSNFNDVDRRHRSMKLAPQQSSTVVLRRAPLRRWLGLFLAVTGVVVLDDVILPTEQGNNSCREVRNGHMRNTQTRTKEDRNSVTRRQLSLADMSPLPLTKHVERPCG